VITGGDQPQPVRDALDRDDFADEFPLYQLVMGRVGPEHDNLLARGGGQIRERRFAVAHEKGIERPRVGHAKVHQRFAPGCPCDDGQHVQLACDQFIPHCVPRSRSDAQPQSHLVGDRLEQRDTKARGLAVLVREAVGPELQFAAGPDDRGLRCNRVAEG
jgi:hypothetical protein